MIYLDNNATTRVDPAVVEAMAPFWCEDFYNPTSLAAELSGIRRTLDLASERLAELLGAEPNEFTLTSGATESNNWVLRSVAEEKISESGHCHILVSEVEHPSVLEAARELQRLDSRIEVEGIPVDECSMVGIDALSELLRPETALVSIMLANNESGVIQPVHELSQLLKQEVPECLFHTDATQAVGKISVDLTSLKGVDFLSLSAHKFHGPKGIGALFKRKGLQLRSWVIGGGQQSGRRAGTENPGLAAGLAKAIELIGSAREIQSRARSIRSLRDRLENGCCQKHPGTKIAGDAAPRLPNTSLMVFPHSEGEMLVHHLLNDGIVASTGAACSKGSDLPSHVLTSMGFDYTIARNSLRLSLSRETTDRHIDCCLRSLESAPGSA